MVTAQADHLNMVAAWAVRAPFLGAVSSGGGGWMKAVPTPIIPYFQESEMIS